MQSVGIARLLRCRRIEWVKANSVDSDAGAMRISVMDSTAHHDKAPEPDLSGWSSTTSWLDWTKSDLIIARSLQIKAVCLLDMERCPGFILQPFDHSNVFL